MASTDPKQVVTRLVHPPSGRRFEGIDEVYFFRVTGGRIAEAWGLEDTPKRLRQLGLSGEP